MNKFKQLLTAIQTFMDTEIELTEQAISHVQRRPRLPYFVGAMVIGSWTAFAFQYVLNLYTSGRIF